MADEPRPRPDPTDILAVRSRVSWAAIFAGAMVALTIYLVLTLLGVALLGEAMARSVPGDRVGIVVAIYSTLIFLVSFFFGGWATSRLAVGESKLEAVLYGLILWGLLFVGLFALVAAGVRAGPSGMVGDATGVGASAAARQPVFSAAMLREMGVSDERIGRMEERGLVAEQGGLDRDAVGASRELAWWSLLGVVVSLTSVILGSLIGSGDLPIPVPIIGVRRTTIVSRS